MKDDTLLEASAALVDIAEALEEGHSTQEQVVATLQSIAEALKDNKPADIKQIADAIRSMKIEQATVHVNVSPTPVNVQVAAPVVHMPPSSAPNGWNVDVHYDARRAIDRMTITPRKA